MFKLSLLNNRFPALHGLRFLCGMYILLGHIIRDVVPETSRGWFVMDAFFVMSGFLIGLIAQHSLVNSRFSILSFYIRRGLRTFPAYYLVLTIAVICYYKSGIDVSLAWREFAYLTNYYALETKPHVMIWGWSLCIEEHFYLVCPFLLLFLKTIDNPRRRFGFIALFIVASLLIRLSMVYSAQEANNYQVFRRMFFSTHTRLDQLFWGILAAQLFFFYESGTGKILNSKWMRFLIPAFSILSFYILSFMQKRAEVGTALAFTLSGFTFAVLILYFVMVKSWVSRFLSIPFFLYGATLIYNVYLIHQYILMWITRPLLMRWGPRWAAYQTIADSLPAVFLTIALSFLLSYIIHLCIDKPALRLRDKWTGASR